MKKIAIYHDRDLDGFTSGAIMKWKYPDIELIGYDYGKEFNWDKITPDIDVLIADVSLEADEMITLASKCNSVTWIDHHISKINDYEKLGNKPDNMTTIFDEKIAACEGTWKYLFPDEDMPKIVELMGKYDSWRQDDLWDTETLPAEYGMQALCNSVDTFPMHLLSTKVLPDRIPVEEIIEMGRIIIKYQKQQNALTCQIGAFESTVLGLRAICLNVGKVNSTTFDSVWDEDKYDIMVPFMFNGKYWTVSLYTTKDDIDCSLLAKKMGGGGHKKASGFQTNNMDFLKNE